jgi:hypothetical protein
MIESGRLAEVRLCLRAVAVRAGRLEQLVAMIVPERHAVVGLCLLAVAVRAGRLEQLVAMIVPERHAVAGLCLLAVAVREHRHYHVRLRFVDVDVDDCLLTSRFAQAFVFFSYEPSYTVFACGAYWLCLVGC